MEAFDPALYPHRCYVLAASESVDADGGVVETFPTDLTGLTPVPCRVRLIETIRGMAGEAEEARTRADLAFPTNPGVAKGARFRRQSDGLQLRALGRAKDRAVGFNFVVSCEVIE